MDSTFLLYGAYGYTGELVAREAVAQGLAPVLAGRRSEPTRALATELGLPWKTFDLANVVATERALAEHPFVISCAGPFFRTARPMVEACLATGTSYLDVTGEIEVFETLAALDGAASEAGILLLPGIGFDVVPTDCLAAHLARLLPGASRLRLGFQALGRVSRGTATTMIENLGRGGAVRRDGRIVTVPEAWRTRKIDFGAGETTAVTVPWGDVSTAYHSTGIGDIEVYTALPPATIRKMKLARWLAPVLRTRFVRRRLLAKVRSGPAGPSESQRERGRTYVWGEVANADGETAVSRLRGPEGYRFTALTAVAAAGKLLRQPEGVRLTGFQTPSRAFGPDFVLEIEGVARGDG